MNFFKEIKKARLNKQTNKRLKELPSMGKKIKDASKSSPKQ